MSKETRRVIVLTQDSYQRLCQAPPPCLAEPRQMKDQATEPMEQQEPTELVEQHDADESMEQEEAVPAEPMDTTLADIPPRYKTDAKALLDKLCSLEEVSWDDTGSLCVRGSQLKLSIEEFLRAVSVPFTKTRLPPVCLQLLQRHQIKPRNHLLSRPQLHQWHQYFQF